METFCETRSFARRSSYVVALTMLLAVVGLAPPAHALSDTSPPQLLGLSFSPSSGNTGAGPVVVTVTAHVTDDVSGANNMNARFYSPVVHQAVFASLGRVSGTSLDGVYQGTATFPQFGETGTWTLGFQSNAGFVAFDAVNNVLALTQSDLSSAGFPTQLVLADAPIITVPNAPTIGIATAGNGSGSVAFTPGANGGSPVLHFDATCTSAGGSVSAPGGPGPIVVSGLTNGETYMCSVTATNAVGMSSSSGASNSFVPFAPPVTASASPTSGPSGTDVTVTGQNWNSAGGPVSLHFLSGGDIGGATVDGSGDLSSNISVGPTEALGSNPIIVTQGSTIVSVPFTVTSGVSAPTLLVAPGSGSAGTVVSLAGQHWPTGGPISVVFSSGPDTGTATVDASGNLTGSITVGSGEPLGSDPIFVFDGSTYASAAFAVTAAAGAPSLSLSPVQGPTGTVVSLSGNNWTAGGGAATVYFEFGNDHGSASIDGAGHLSGSITVGVGEGLGANQVVVRQDSTIVSAAFTVLPSSSSAPYAFANVSKGGIGTVVSIGGHNWDSHGGAVSVRWTNGPDTGTATVDGFGNLTGAITVGAAEASGSNPIIITQGSTTVRVSVGVLPSGGAGSNTPVGGGGLPPGDPVRIDGPGGVSCLAIVAGDGTFGCQLPIHGPPGHYFLTVTDGSITFTIPFEILPPTASATPNQGPPGTQVAITGTLWDPTGPPVSVKFTDGTDVGTASVDASGNLTAHITVSAAEMASSNPIIVRQGAFSLAIPFNVLLGASGGGGGPVCGAVAPGALRIGGALPGNGTAKVHWNAPASNGGAAVDGYVVTPFLGYYAQPATVFTSTKTTQTITGLKNGKSYVFKVAARNACGAGARSKPGIAVTVGTPLAPTGITAITGHGSATLRWKASTITNGKPLKGYTIAVYLGAKLVKIVSVGVTIHATITGLTKGKTYTLRISAKNIRGIGPQSVPPNTVKPT